MKINRQWQSNKKFQDAIYYEENIVTKVKNVIIKMKERFDYNKKKTELL